MTMSRLRAWWKRLTGLVFVTRRERELAAELEAHFQLHVDDNIRAGMTPDEARRAAVLKFGPVEALKDEYRERASVPLLANLAQDVRHGLRRMRRQPGFTALIALTLALGVGANAAMFGLVDVLMFRTPAHVREPERIVRVGAPNYVAYQGLRERLHSIELTAYTRQTLSFGQGTDAVPFRAECVTPTYFSVAGVSPWRGRAFLSDDDRPGAPRTIVLSHGFWNTHFSADPDVIGSPILLAGHTFDIVGIAPRGFTGLAFEAIDGWILLTAAPETCSFSNTNLLQSADSFWLTALGRLQDDVAPAQAAAELLFVEPDVEGRPKQLVDGTLVDGSFELAPLYASRRLRLSADSRLALWLAGGAAALFLLACANIAGLLWTQTLDRGREMALRLQLGASRARIFAQLFTEHLMIAIAAGVVAVLVGAWIGRGVRQYFPVAVDADLMGTRTLLVVAALALAAGVLIGVVPAIHASRWGAERFLRTGQPVMAARPRGPGALLSLQVGLALVLVSAAGLFVDSVNRHRRDFLYDLDRVVVASADFRKSSIGTPQEIRAVFRLLEERVRALPQVERTALSAAPLLGGPVSVVAIRRSQDAPSAEMNARHEVSPDYFATLGLRMVSGRGFTEADRHGTPVVINEALAATLFPGEDAIGQPLLVGNRQREIVGVSRVFRNTIRPDDQVGSQIFVPLTEASDSQTTPQLLLVRTRGSASPALPAIASALQSAAPDLPYVSVRTLEDLADAQARSWLLGARVFGLFGTLAVVLAGIGIYGALAFTIRRRTVEIGVRMALGAMRRDIARMVLQQGALVVSFGLVLGLAGAFAGSGYVQNLLFDAAAVNPTAFVTASAVVIVAALVGCLVPAVRAARVDPAVALRVE